MKKRAMIFLTICIIVVVSLVITLVYILNIIPHSQYENIDFNIETYKSEVDKDGDGVDDQTDMLTSVRKYIETKPVYKSKYYATDRKWCDFCIPHMEYVQMLWLLE